MMKNDFMYIHKIVSKNIGPDVLCAHLACIFFVVMCAVVSFTIFTCCKNENYYCMRREFFHKFPCVLHTYSKRTMRSWCHLLITRLPSNEVSHKKCIHTDVINIILAGGPYNMSSFCVRIRIVRLLHTHTHTRFLFRNDFLLIVFYHPSEKPYSTYHPMKIVNIHFVWCEWWRWCDIPKNPLYFCV